MDQELWDRQTCARFLGLDPRTLDLWRQKKFGPPVIKLGGGRGVIRYRRTEVEAWLDAQTLRFAPTDLDAAA